MVPSKPTDCSRTSCLRIHKPTHDWWIERLWFTCFSGWVIIKEIEPTAAEIITGEAHSTPNGRVGGNQRTRNLLIPTLTFVGIVVAAEMYIRIADVPSFLIPAPSQVLEDMVLNIDTAWPNISVTLLETLLGFAASIVVGVALAILLVSFRPLEAAIYPLLVASQVVPKVAIAPIFLVWWGFGLFPKVMLVFLMAFFPIIISTSIGFKETETETLHLAQTMGATKLQTFSRFRMPNALPSIFGGIKIAATLAVVGAVVAEFVGSDRGLGHAIVRANARLDTAAAFGSMLYLTLLGVGLYMVVDLIERAAIPWHVSRRQDSLPTSSDQR